MRPQHVLWLAQGLNPEVTGIEGFVLDVAARLTSEKLLAPGAWTVVVDSHCTWSGPLAELGATVVTNRPRRRDLAQFEIIHTFGRNLVPRSSATKISSIYDWGPFVDGSMKPKSRLAWAAPMVFAHWRSDIIHYLNSNLETEKPPGIPPANRSVVCYPTASHAIRFDLEQPEFGLFVGTNSNRKRLNDLSICAGRAGVPIVLAGSGTETIDGDFVTSLGRVSQTELIALYARASCLLLLSSYEGFGIPVLEAAMNGIHSVVSVEIYKNLPPELQSYCSVVRDFDPESFAGAVSAATSRRGIKLSIDLLQPMARLYAELCRGEL